MRNRRRELAGAGVVFGAALLFFAIGNADAQTPPPSPITLLWNAPAGCSDSAAILKEVADLRGGNTAAAGQMSAIANVTLDNASGVWNLQIATNFADGTHGERQIQAESCKAAADATASILALALTARATEIAASSTPPTATPTADVDAAAAPTTNEDAGASRPTQIPPPAPTEEKKPNEPPPASSTPIGIHPYVAGFFGGTTGDLPSIGLGGGGAFGASYRFVRAELYGDYYAFGRTRFGNNGAANFQVFSAGGRTCLSFGDSFSLGPCAAFELGSMSGQSFNVTVPSSGTALVANGFLGMLGTLPLDENRRFALRALLEIGASFEQPQFVLDGVGFVHQPALVIGRGTVGAELHF